MATIVPSEIVGTGAKAATTVTTTAITDDNAPKTRNQLKANEFLSKDEKLVSTSGRFQFVNQGDGNLVLYDGTRAIWASQSNGSGTRTVTMQPDGNLVMKEVGRRWDEWSSRTGGRGNATSTLIMQDDGNVVILSDGQQIWQTDTKQRMPADELKPFKAGDSLGKEEALLSPNRKYRLVMQSDNNLVLTDTTDKNRVIWSTDSGTSAARPKLTLGTDGNLVVYDGSYARWSSNTAGKGDSSSILLVQDDGDVVIRSKDVTIWSAGSKPRSKENMDRLAAGEILRRDELLRSPNGKYELVMQGDNNLVLYDVASNRRAMWASRSGTSLAKPKLQLGIDGNLVVYDGTYARWSSNTNGKGDSTSILKIQDDGNVVLTSKGVQIWQTDTKQRPKSNNLKAGESLRNGESMASSNGYFAVIMQGDGNLVIYDQREGSRALWSSKSNILGDRAKATLRTNGNFVVAESDTDGQWGPPWQSNTKGSNAVVTMQDDGNLVVTADGKEIWSSNTTQRTTAKPKKDGNRDSFYVGEWLTIGEKLTSANGKYYLDISNGSIRLCQTDGTQLWIGGRSAGLPTEKMQLRGDGEVELQDRDGSVKWTTGTAGRGNVDSYLMVQNDGNFGLMTGGKLAWHTNTRRETDGTIKKVDRLQTGETLGRDQRLTSPNGKYEMVYQSDGNFCLYEGTKVLWSANSTRWSTSVAMRDDDNLVVTSQSSLDWSSGTRRRLGGGTAVLILQDDGRAIIKSDGNTIWSTDGKGVSAPAIKWNAVKSGASQIKRGECLNVGSYLESPNGQYTATLQSDGDFALRHKSSSIPLWTSNTAPNSAVTKLVMQYDCNCLMLGANDAPVWSTDTSNQDRDAILKLKDDGNMFVDGGGFRGWATDIRYPAFNGTINQLKRGESLQIGQSISSPNGQYRMTFSDAGQILVTYQGRTTYYYLQRGVSDAKTLYIANYGDTGSPIVIIKNSKGGDVYRGSSGESSLGRKYRERQREWNEKSRWAESNGFRQSGDNGPKQPNWGEPRFAMQDDGNVTIRYEDEDVWTLKSKPSGPTTTPKNSLSANEELRVGQSLVSPGYSHYATYQADGNFVVYKSDGSTLWDSKTNNTSPGRVTLLSNAYLAIYDASNTTKWTSTLKNNQFSGFLGSSGNPYTTMQDDGNLVTYVFGSNAVWASKDSRW